MKLKPTNTIYERKKQLHSGFKIVRYQFFSDGRVKKATIKKGLSLIEADNEIYRLESKNKRTK